MLLHLVICYLLLLLIASSRVISFMVGIVITIKKAIKKRSHWPMYKTNIKTNLRDSCCSSSLLEAIEISFDFSVWKILIRYENTTKIIPDGRSIFCEMKKNLCLWQEKKRLKLTCIIIDIYYFQKNPYLKFLFVPNCLKKNVEIYYFFTCLLLTQYYKLTSKSR